MTISEKVAYLKGLAEGLNLDVEKSKEGKLISVMIGILEEVGLSIEDLEENALALGEEIDTISDDLADVESVVYGEDEDEDDYFEVECPNCEEPIVIDDKALAEGEVECPSCQTKFSLTCRMTRWRETRSNSLPESTKQRRDDFATPLFFSPPRRTGVQRRGALPMAASRILSAPRR